MKKLTTLIITAIAAVALFAGCTNLDVKEGAPSVTEGNVDVTWQSGDVTGVSSELFNEDIKQTDGVSKDEVIKAQTAEWDIVMSGDFKVEKEEVDPYIASIAKGFQFSVPQN